MRESIHAIRFCDFLTPLASGSGRGKPSAIMHIGFFARTQSFQAFLLQARVVLKPLGIAAGIANRPPHSSTRGR